MKHLDKARRGLRLVKQFHFTWRGEPIDDIEAWAAARGEQMVEFCAVLDYVDYPPQMLNQPPRMVHDEYEGAAPESFFDSLIACVGSPYGSYRYQELRRRPPKVPGGA